MKYNINRRKFLELFTGSCCGLALPSCTKVPITERRQLTVYPESTINKQASAAYAKFKSSSKLITKGSQLDEIVEIGKKIEVSVQAFFKKKIKMIQPKVLSGTTF